MKVCLVLLSGLPGAGKTTLSQAVRDLRERQAECLTMGVDAPSHYVIDAVLELDAFMNENGNSDEVGFTPERWQSALTAVRGAAHKQLLYSLLEKERNSVTRLVFLVDTLPYKSMRVVYWKMCRDLNQMQLKERQEESDKNAKGVTEVKKQIESDMPSLVGMIEVRLNTPLGVCLERNEERRGTPQYIPVHVIKKMSESFDVGVTPFAVSVADENCWMIVHPPTTPSWPVIQLRDEKTHALLSPSLLAHQLLERLFSSEITCELEKQRVVLVTSELQGRMKEAHQQKQQELDALDTLSRKRFFHQLDLRMRGVVREYMGNRKNSGIMNTRIGAEVSKCREEHHAWIKALLTQHETFHSMSESEKDAFIYDLLLEFRRKLSEL